MTDANGLYYMRARYYSPELKRFINADVVAGDIANAITLNRYAYANGNPVSNIDPFGLSAERGGTKYDRDAAVEYAEKYAYGWNRDYMYMNDLEFIIEYFILYLHFSGSDCANFVSQCLEAGGIKQNADWNFSRVDNTPWPSSVFAVPEVNIPLFSDRNGHTTHRPYDYVFTAIWTGAKSQYEYFSNPDNGYTDYEEIIISSKKDLKKAIKGGDIQKGDLMYFENKKGIHHATIISSITDSDILYAAHSDQRFNESVLGKLGNEKVHIIRLKDYY